MFRLADSGCLEINSLNVPRGKRLNSSIRVNVKTVVVLHSLTFSYILGRILIIFFPFEMAIYKSVIWRFYL